MQSTTCRNPRGLGFGFAGVLSFPVPLSSSSSSKASSTAGQRASILTRNLRQLHGAVRRVGAGWQAASSSWSILTTDSCHDSVLYHGIIILVTTIISSIAHRHPSMDLIDIFCSRCHHSQPAPARSIAPFPVFGAILLAFSPSGRGRLAAAEHICRRKICEPSCVFRSYGTS